ncbi:MAG: glycoside hydrolase family 16 protein, partial [Paludibacteraceae bacterium]|nr:glycoside hydrolase family 16 protein [Paludibacteraceae bacterium]
TSGRVNTKGKVAYMHGKVEALIKLPKTYKGLWPAFWMMGNDYNSVGWPKCGEIDILEMGNQGGFGSVDKSEKYLNGACHWGYYKDGNYPNYGKSSTYQYSVQDGEYHLFTLIWDETQINTYIDLDKYPNVAPYYTIGIEVPADGPHAIGTCWDTGCYFHKDFFVILNLAVGGHFPGITNINGITAFNEANGYEAQMLIDYVRIYQK